MSHLKEVHSVDLSVDAADVAIDRVAVGVVHLARRQITQRRFGVVRRRRRRDASRRIFFGRIFLRRPSQLLLMISKLSITHRVKKNPATAKRTGRPSKAEK